MYSKLFVVGILFSAGFFTVCDGDDSLPRSVVPFLKKHCVKCHQESRTKENKKLIPKGGVDLGVLKSEKDLLDNSELVGQILDVLDAEDMPPETEPRVPDNQRRRIIGLLKKALAEAVGQNRSQSTTVRRLNRFQYNYAVRDLFRLDRDVFALPEKLMTRHSNYLKGNAKRLPDEVRVASYALNPRPGLRGVKAFPKDLRAAHGYDNQTNQLTMSPLLLDSFLRLAVSIIESEDFNEKTVGIWNEFFLEPVNKSKPDTEIKTRLRRFLTRAFRLPVEDEVVERYSKFVNQKMNSGMAFTEAMKKVASAALSSPLFLYRVESGRHLKNGVTDLRQFELASRLSFLLWSSGPDDELMRLAAKGDLAKQDVLESTVKRMFADPKIERFLDTFPSQWLQLENVLAATPDPGKQRFFSLDKNNPASLQMLIEPLLLMDAAFIENRPITELVQPSFGYQSEFLRTWYTSNLKPPRVDVEKIIAKNQDNDRLRKSLSEQVKQTKKQLSNLIDPVREQLLAEKNRDRELKPIDLKPLAAWEFEGNLKASVGGLDLSPHGKIDFKDGQVQLDRSFLLSKPIPVDLKAKTLEVWCIVPNLDMRGGGVIGIQGQGDFFDTIVIGERQPRHWISGSNGFSRTLDFAESQPETKTTELLHLVMVYQADGTTLLYRNGQPYGKPFKRSRAVFPKNKSQVIFGLRHLPAGGNKFLKVFIDRAAIYNRALTPEEVAAANSGKHLFVSDNEITSALSEEQKKIKADQEQQLADQIQKLKNVPATQDPNRAIQDSRSRYDNEIRRQLRDQVFRRTQSIDPRFGGIITNAAIMSMTSGPKRSHPIARGAWIIEVIFNDPPPPPPNDVPPLNEESGDKNLTIREKFKVHRENPDCAGCHSRLDPLGFAMENFDLTGRWREKYSNGREVDMKGTLNRRHPFSNVVEFKQAIIKEDDRLAKAFAKHLLRFALSRELTTRDRLVVDQITQKTKPEKHRFRTILREVILSEAFLQTN